MIWTSVRATPISCTRSPYIELFWSGAHCPKSLVICNFAVPITNHNCNQIARFVFLSTSCGREIDAFLSHMLWFKLTKNDLRGPVVILFISRDTCSDSIAKVFRACFVGHRTIIARYDAKWGIAWMRLCETKCRGGVIALPPLTVRQEKQCLYLGHLFRDPCTPGPFSLQYGAFSEEFPQSRPCTTRIWACTTG